MHKVIRHKCFGCLLIVALVIGLMPVYFHFRYDCFNLRRPRTLMEAIAKGNVRAVEKFLQTEDLETGPSAPSYLIEAIDWLPSFFRREYTPTEEQIERRNVIIYDMVKLLIEHGADINQSGRSGDTPLIVALSRRMPKVAHYLVEQGASVNIFNNRSDSPLMYASAEVDTIRLLLNYNAKETINHVNVDGDSALHRAYYPECVELLLDNGADPTIRNNKGQTPLEQARKNNWTDKADFLEKYMETYKTNGVDSDTLSGMQND